MNAELVTKDFLKETLSHEFEKFSTILVTEFGRIDGRFNKVDIRFDRVEGRLDKVENRLGNVELRLGSLETKVDELSDTLEQEMAFTSDLRDNLDKRVHVLERKRS